MLKKTLWAMGVRKEFQQLFFINEYRTLAGKANAWVLLLAIILFLALLALGFAVGGLKALSLRMDDPFTNWVNLQIGRAVKDSDIEDIRQTFAQPANRDSFLLNGIGEYVIWQERFTAVGGSNFYKKGRTVDFENDLFAKILEGKSGNVLGGTALPPADSSHSLPACGLVVTLSMLESLGYEAPVGQRKILLDFDGQPIWLEIIAVVKSLPNLCDFACSPNLFNLLTQPPDETGFVSVASTSNIVSFISPRRDLQKVEKWAKARLGGAGLNRTKQQPFTAHSNRPAFRYDLVLNQFLDKPGRDSLMDILAAPDVQPYVPCACNEQYQHIAAPYYLAFNFSRLDRVRAFRQFMQQRYGIEISMDQVEAKENFALVSRLTLFMAVVLFVFGMGSIVSFVNSLLRTHLEKIKPNLGTFKAFGLGNVFLKNIYSKIVMYFLFVAMLLAVVAVLLVFAFGKILFENNYLDVVNGYLLIACAAIVLAGLLLTQMTIRRTLLDTPGNLIYGRG